MIEGFKGKGVADLFNGLNTKAARALLPKQLWERAGQLLDQLNAAVQVGDMALPPSNQLEKLKGDRAGQWSVRINKQYHICFYLEGGQAKDVEIVDYH